MPHFVQLPSDSAQYLLDLIREIDSDTKYTERQRGYTVPKLQKLLKDPRAARLAFQDTSYLLELIDDDDLEEYEQIREMTRETLEEIQSLQASRFDEMKDIESQRQARRAKRQPAKELQLHFEHTSAQV
jgi:hypothetical protein